MIYSTSTEEKICGKIISELAQRMDDQEFNFKNKEYKCDHEVVYTAESP
jgi:hypothetical protein